MKCVIFLFRITSQYKCSLVFITNTNFISNKKPKCKILSHFTQVRALSQFASSLNEFFVVFYKKRKKKMINTVS